MQVLGTFFKSVVQVILLFGYETWVLTPRMGQTLGGVPSQDGRLSDSKITVAATWRHMIVAPPPMGSDGGGGAGGSGGIYQVEEEYGRAVYFVMENSGPL